MNQYNIEQKLIPGPYPEIRIIANISKMKNDNEKIDTVSIRKTITHWEAYDLKAVKPILAHFIGLAECLEHNIFSKQDHMINDKLYGFVHIIEEDGKEVYTLEFALCKDHEHADKILEEKISNGDDKYWSFFCCSNINENILKILYNKCKFIIMIEELPISIITNGIGDDYDKYVAFSTKVEIGKDKGDNKNE